MDVAADGDMAIHGDRRNMSTELSRIAELAKGDRKRQFLSIAHLLTPEALQRAFEGLRKDASGGVDGVTHREYQADAKGNIQKLWKRTFEATLTPS